MERGIQTSGARSNLIRGPPGHYYDIRVFFLQLVVLVILVFFIFLFKTYLYRVAHSE